MFEALLAIISSLGIYASTMKVIAVNGTDVAMVDANGYEWRMTEATDWEVGDLASIIMWDNGTPENIFDDWIITAHFAGTVEMFQTETIIEFVEGRQTWNCTK